MLALNWSGLARLLWCPQLSSKCHPLLAATVKLRATSYGLFPRVPVLMVVVVMTGQQKLAAETPAVLVKTADPASVSSASWAPHSLGFAKTRCFDKHQQRSSTADQKSAPKAGWAREPCETSGCRAGQKEGCRRHYPRRRPQQSADSPRFRDRRPGPLLLQLLCR